MFVSPKNLYVKSLTLKVIVLRGGGSGRWLGYEGRALINGISALIKRPKRNLALSITWKWALSRHRICQHHDLGLPASRTVRSKYLLFIGRLVYGMFFIAVQTN
uniref:Uncharacterized protein n=1 Tax=Pan troglodytes TaxID=9598 RepID=G2HJP8_PANTR|nr:hypothetical protein [Pan troglodytes]